MRLAMLLVAVLAGGCSPPDQCAGILQPPEGMRGPPLFPIGMREVSSGQVGNVCQTMGMKTDDALACTRTGAGPTLIVLPEIDGVVTTYARQNCLLHHEFGHLNGATADHAGWR